MKSITKIIGVLLIIFIAVPSFAQQKTIKKVDKIERRDAKMKELKVALNLTNEQFGKIKAIVDEQHNAMKKERISKGEMNKMENNDKKVARAEARLERAKMQKATDAKIKAVLTPEQIVKYEAYKKEQKEIQKEERKERIQHRMENEDSSIDEVN